MAAKTYYFGVGGGTNAFEVTIAADGGAAWRVESVARFEDGSSNCRAILKVGRG